MDSLIEFFDMAEVAALFALLAFLLTAWLLGGRQSRRRPAARAGH